MSDTKEDEEMMEAHLLNDYGEAPIEAESKQEELPQLENAGENVVSVNQNLDLSTEFDANNTINALDDGRNAPVANGNDEEDQGSFEPVVDGNNTGNKSNGNDTVDAIVIEESKTNGVDANVIEESKTNGVDAKEFEESKTNGVDAKEFENGVFDTKTEDESVKEIIKREVSGSDMAGRMVLPTEEKNAKELEVGVKQERVGVEMPKTPHPLAQEVENDELSGTEEEQVEFTKELEKFYKEKNSEFKPPKFYGKEINCLKLWRAVTKLGGYDQVTGCKLWKHVGGTFNPPKTCTTVSWTFRGFYEKALLDYERHNRRGSEPSVPFASLTDSVSVENQISGNQASGSGRVRRESATRAMQGWHSQRLLGNGEVGDPIIKEKSLISMPMHEKQIETDGVHKVKKSSNLERTAKAMHTTAKASKLQMDVEVVDVGPPADWVKINVRRTKDCFEVYALVPGLLREEVRVQSDPAGRLVISGEPEKPDNPWGVTPFKKVVSLPCRIDPLHTSAVVTLHGQLFVRAPFEQSKP